MSISLRTIRNADDSLLVWSVPEPIPKCAGFAVRREMEHGGEASTVWLDNFIGFAGEAHKDGERRLSTEWPIQGFTWTDHEPDLGDTARYQVVPLLIQTDGSFEAAEPQASEWAQGKTTSERFQPFFNRGYVMSQFMARYLKSTGQSLSEFKKSISEEDDLAIRVFLAGELRTRLLSLLHETQTNGGQVHLALFELSDPELIDALTALGPRAHLVLANGSITARKGESGDEARRRDGNEAARHRLRAAEVDVEEANRFLSPGALGHNKFAVFTDATGAAATAWTGSTNWTPTGLCTQLNNGLLIRDPAIAAVFLEQWERLRKARSEFPPDLVDANSQPKPVASDATVWFSRTHSKVDLDALRELIDGASSGLLFLMFQPGGTGVLRYVLERRAKDPELFVRGVVSELPNGAGNESAVDVTIVGDGDPEEHRLDVIQPEGRPNPFAWWAAEATHKEVRAQIGYAIVHSKVLVIDPLSDDPVVVTGSHNFSENASAENDENFIVVRGDAALAEGYAVNVFGAWRHYRARVASGKPYAGLQKGEAWMAASLRSARRQSAFWGFPTD